MGVVDGKLLALIIFTVLISWVSYGWYRLNKTNDKQRLLGNPSHVISGFESVIYVLLWPVVILVCYKRGYNVKR